MTRVDSLPGSRRSRLLGPIPLLAAATLAMWSLPALIPRLLKLLGFEFSDKWFVDSYAILAALDARRAGLDPMQPNPLDLFQRPHCYSDWWFALGPLGLTRSANFAVGFIWVAGFLALALLVLRPRNTREALLAFAFLASPALLLAVFRANNDLVVFALVGGAALVLRRDTSGRIVAAAGLIALAAGLKFYPLVAGLFVLLIRPRSRRRGLALVVGAMLAAVFWSVGPTMSRGDLPLPIDIHKTGAPVLLSDLGWTGRIPQAGAALAIAMAGLVFARRRWTTGLAEPEPASMGKQYSFLLGAALLTGCFVAGVSHAYRWVFTLLLLPWLWEQAHVSATRRSAVVTLVLLGFVCWGDGLFCLILNLAWSPSSTDAVAHVEHEWRLASQPWHWLLVALLAGWLWDAALAAARAERNLSAV